MNKQFHFLFNWKILIILSIIFYISITGIYNFFQQKSSNPASNKFTEIKHLLNDSYSENSDITFNIPKGFDIDKKKLNVGISPFVVGMWKYKDESSVVFRPTKKFKKGEIYTATIMTNKGVIGDTFFVEENPKVISVLPGEGGEVDEDSKITISFNRPMVALSVANDIEQNELNSVKIRPKTDGKFRWIGTRTLQFIPDNSLIPATDYRVSINGLKSVDSVSVDGYQFTFSTRHLRVKSILDNENISFDTPIRISFNQNVNIESFLREVNVTKNDEVSKEIIDKLPKIISKLAKTLGRKIENTKIIAEYLNDGEKNEDRSVILVYNKNDKYGRRKKWDADSSYILKFNRLKPEKGEYGIDKSIETSFTTAGFIEKVIANSDNFQNVSQFYFDPNGQLEVKFSEEVDLEKTIFKNKKIASISYKKKCKELDIGKIYNNQEECEKIDDLRSVKFTFKENSIGLGEEEKININKFVNTDGTEFESKNLNIKFKSYPKLLVRKVNSFHQNTTKSFVICSTTPLYVDNNKDNIFKISKELKFKSIYVGRTINTEKNNFSKVCDKGEFETSVYYKAFPKTNYTFKAELKDIFGQKVQFEETFETADISQYDKNIVALHNSYEYNITTPDHTKLSYNLINVSDVHVDICKMNPREYLRQGNRIDNKIEDRCNIIKTDDIHVKHEVYWEPVVITVDLKKYFSTIKGYYKVTLTSPELLGRNGNMIKYKSLINITNIGSVQKVSDIGESMKKDEYKSLRDLYWVFDISNELEAIKNAKIDVYEKKPDKSIEKKYSIITDKKGIAQGEVFVNNIGAIIHKDDDSAVVGILYDRLEYTPSSETAKKAYIYTDRPIYRPGEDVFIKGMVRIGFDGMYEYKEGEKVDIEVNNSIGDIIYKDNLFVGEYGTINTSVKLPENAPLGIFSIKIDGVYAGRGVFEVQEYESSPFKVDINLNKEEYIQGDNAQIEVDAKYFFGAVVDGGEIEYSITTQDYYFDKFADDKFNFDERWYNCYYNCYFNDKFITKKNLALDKNGKAKIILPIKFDKWFKEKDNKSVIATINVTVKNKNGQSVSHKKSFVIHAGKYYLGILTGKYFIPKDEDVDLQIKSVNEKGEEASVKNLSLVVSKIEWKSNKRQEVDGGYYYNSKKELIEVDKISLETDNFGNWNGKHKFSDIGEYQLKIEGTDSEGNRITKTKEIYVWGSGYGQVHRTNNTDLEIKVESSSVSVGDKGRLIFESPFKKAKAFVSIERGKVYEFDILDISGSFVEYNFPIKEKYVPNIFGSITLVSEYPELKHGSVEFSVNKKEKELLIEVITDKDIYLSGEEVNLQVQTRDNKGNGVASEISLSVSDLSVLALKGNPKKDPLIFFYGGFPLTVSTSSNVKNIIHEVDVDNSTKGGGGGAKATPMLEIKKRGDFRSTAFWKYDIVTDSSGNANISFTLPDNLTTWQIESLGITKDTKIGKEYKEFVVTKNVLLKPIAPKFILPNDKFLIGAHIFNQTKEEKKFVVRIESDTLILQEKQEKEIIVSSGESQIVYFDAVASKEKKDGVHIYSLYVNSDNFQDAIEKTIKIEKNNAFEVVATSGHSSLDVTEEYLYVDTDVVSDAGGVTISHSATLAIFLDDAIDYLIEYPYGCSEQIASKLRGIAIAMRMKDMNGNMFTNESKLVFNDKEYLINDAIKNGLKKLYKNQLPSGGFTYFGNSNLKADFYLTLYITQVLELLVKEGVDVQKEYLNNAYNYIDKNMWNYADKHEKNKESIYIFVAEAFSGGNMLNDKESLVYEINTIIKNDKFLYDDISMKSLATLAVVVGDNLDVFSKGQIDKVFETLENKIQINSKGAFIDLNEDNVEKRYYETPINNTSIALKAIIKAKRAYQHTDKIIRWLLKSRNKENVWDTTNTTANVLDAFVEYMDWTQEFESRFSLETYLNNEIVNKFIYDDTKVFSQNKIEIPMVDIKKGEISSVIFKKNNNGKNDSKMYYDIELKYAFPMQKVGVIDRGFNITNELYNYTDTNYTQQLTNAKVGDVLRGKIQITVPKERHFVSIENFLPAGVSLINTDFATENIIELEIEEDTEFKNISSTNNVEFYPTYKELRDDRLFLFKEQLSAGVYEYEYFVRVNNPGKFQVLPTIVSEMYFPEVFGRTNGRYFNIEK